MTAITRSSADWSSHPGRSSTSKARADFERASADRLPSSCSSNIVLATGGGAVMLTENRRVLAANGTVVYLRASPADLWHRTRHDRNCASAAADDESPRGSLDQLFTSEIRYIGRSRPYVDTGSQSVSASRMLEHRLREHSEVSPESDRDKAAGTTQPLHRDAVRGQRARGATATSRLGHSFLLTNRINR